MLRLDGQNLCQTVLDTGELSVLRGGGLALLYAPEKLFARLRALGHVLEEVYYGSSEGLAYLTVPEGKAVEDYERELHGHVWDFLNGVAGPKDDDLTQDLLPILPFLTVSFATLPESGDFSADHRALLNKNRTRQYQALSVDMLPPETTWKTGQTVDGDSYEKPCQVDRTRPISQEIGKGKKKLAVSDSVYYRQLQGKRLRQRFYREELSREKDLPAWGQHLEDIRQAILRGDGAYRFSDHFGEIALPPARKEMKVPLKLQGKMAVIYADGNRFGEIKRDLCKQPDDYRDFSLHVQRKRRQLLSKVIEVVCGALVKDPDGSENWLIPMETLLWGGDELCLVMPAWSALKVLETIAPLLDEGWVWRGRELTHAWGLVFCHHKTPIREVRSLAEGLAESVKDLRDEQGRQVGRAGNYLQYMVLMGMDPPVGGVECFREAHYRCTTATPFTFDLQHLSQTMATLKEFLGLAVGSTGKVSDGVPPSQLYKLREWAMRDRLLDQAEDQPGFQAWLEKATERLKAYRDSRGEPFSWQHVKDAHMAYHRRYPLMPLFHILHLGDYVEPFQSRGGAA
jgi:hypothetical protein